MRRFVRERRQASPSRRRRRRRCCRRVHALEWFRKTARSRVKCAPYQNAERILKSSLSHFRPQFAQSRRIYIFKRYTSLKPEAQQIGVGWMCLGTCLCDLWVIFCGAKECVICEGSVVYRLKLYILCIFKAYLHHVLKHSPQNYERTN